MATRKTSTSAAQSAYDPGTQYRVQLAARVDTLGQTFYPGQDLTLRGDVLAGLDAGAVASAEAVLQPGAEG